MDRSKLARRLIEASHTTADHEKKASRMSTIDETFGHKTIKRERKDKAPLDKYTSRTRRGYKSNRSKPCKCQQNHTSETDLSDIQTEIPPPPPLSDVSDFSSSLPFTDEYLIRRKRRRRLWWPSRETRAQMIPVITSSIGTFIVGFSVAYHALSEFIPPSLANHLWVQNLFCLCGMFGAIFHGMIISWPRKKLLSIMSMAQVISWLLVLFGRGELLLLGSRGIAGFASGITVGLVQVYISEISHPSNRGLAASLPTFASIFGSLVCFSASRVISWYYVGICGLIVSIVHSLALMSILPESFRYLIRKGKPNSAMRSLEKLRGRPEIHPEFNAVQDACDILSLEKDFGTLKIFRPEFYKPVYIAGAIMFFGQFSGIDGVLLFAFERYKNDALPSSGFTHFPVVVLYCLQLVATLVCGFLIDKKGKKLMLLVSTGTCAAAGLALGLYILFEDLEIVDPAFPWNWIPVACVIIYAGAFSLGLGPIPWMLFGEFAPYKHKGLAVVILGLLFWLPSLCINVTFVLMQSKLYLSGTLWFYTIFCIFGYLFVLLKLPDFKCVSLETIQLHFISCRGNKIVDRY
ncbi:facilitated trehalose transporter Tret1-like [Artemia franciscana]|uniref:Major facilitator superfamily (MFS) profile domain-containing protein n=1 Tax=Artemia franciscana TaxID=6661 RepID=A0AA88I850_ARTSF|nr:hypothetical protein QYM36_003793 [Artemia franciscana]